jgi:hypothetical protein
MTDARADAYCSPYNVTKYYKPGATQTAVALASETGLSQTNKDRVYLALANLTALPGDYIRVYNSGVYPRGEIVQVQNVVETGSTSYLEIASNLTQTYTTTASSMMEVLSAFNQSSNPSTQEVLDIIADESSYIDEETHTAWRVKNVTDEYHSIDTMPYDPYKGRAIYLNFRPVITDTSDGFVTTLSDSLKIFSGTAWTDWVTTKTAGRASDYWVNGTDGVVYVKLIAPVHNLQASRTTYRYGHVTSALKPNPPSAIVRACAKLVAADLLEMEPDIVMQPSGEGLPSLKDRITAYREDAEELINHYREMTIY